MIRVEMRAKQGEVTLHMDDEGIANLRSACDDAVRGNKVFLGGAGGMLILRPEGFQGKEEPDD